MINIFCRKYGERINNMQKSAPIDDTLSVTISLILSTLDVVEFLTLDNSHMDEKRAFYVRCIQCCLSSNDYRYILKIHHNLLFTLLRIGHSMSIMGAPLLDARGNPVWGPKKNITNDPVHHYYHYKTTKIDNINIESKSIKLTSKFQCSIATIQSLEHLWLKRASNSRVS